jgi:hypothetical protein
LKSLLKLAPALALAAALGGCVNPFTWLQGNVLDPAAAVINNPNTKVVATFAAQTITALGCVVAKGTAVAAQIESDPAFGVDKNTQNTNYKIYVVSSIDCNALGGILDGSSQSVGPGTPIAAPIS